MNVGIVNEFNNKFENKAVIKVCGIGGGGGNAVGRMVEAGMQDVEFITINTDAQALRSSPAGTKLQIGDSGLGAGAKPEVARQAAEEEREQIENLLQGADMIFLTAGLGGGTGTGATPVVAEVAKKTGALTVAIVTLPFTFENPARMEKALSGLNALQPNVDACIVIPNDHLYEMCEEDVSLLEAFRLADEVLYNGVRAISELITTPGLINLDFADVRTIMQNSGRALMGIGTAEGEQRAVRAADEAIVCPLLENSRIDGALGVIVNVQGGRDIGMREVHTAVSIVQKAAHPEANIIFGAVVDDEERPEIKVTVIAAGFDESRAQEATPREATQPQRVPPSKPESVEKTMEEPREEPAIELTDTTPEDTRKEEIRPPEQIMIPEEQPIDDDPDIPAYIRDGNLDIPAFMRKRMKK